MKFDETAGFDLLGDFMYHSFSLKPSVSNRKRLENAIASDTFCLSRYVTLTRGLEEIRNQGYGC